MEKVFWSILGIEDKVNECPVKVAEEFLKKSFIGVKIEDAYWSKGMTGIKLKTTFEYERKKDA